MGEKKEYIERGLAVQLLRECTQMQGKEIEKECDMPILRNVLNVYYLAREGAATLLEDIPAADVVKVVHGGWKKLRGMAPPEYHGRHICSECGRMAREWKMHEILTDYCPHCGAKMDGGKHEQHVFV